MRKLLLLFSTVVALLLCACSGLNGFIGYTYDDPDNYTVGNAVVLETIKEVDIDWINGEVILLPADGNDISFREEANRDLDDDEVIRWVVDGNTLKIKYMASGIRTVENLTKELTVYLPKDVYDSIEISTVSAEITVTDVACDEFEADTTSGSISAAELSATEIDVSTISGTVSLSVSEKDADSIELDSTSGDLNLYISSCRRLVANTVSGKIHVTADGNLYEADLDTTSGEIICQGGKIVYTSTVSGLIQLAPSESYEKCEADSTSGDVILYLSDNVGFELNFDSVSGDYSSELPLTKDGGKLVYDNENAKIEVDTVSGDLSIHKTVTSDENTDSENRGVGRYS